MSNVGFNLTITTYYRNDRQRGHGSCPEPYTIRVLFIQDTIREIYRVSRGNEIWFWVVSSIIGVQRLHSLTTH